MASRTRAPMAEKAKMALALVASKLSMAGLERESARWWWLSATRARSALLVEEVELEVVVGEREILCRAARARMVCIRKG